MKTLLALLAFTLTAAAGEVKLGWSPSPDPRMSTLVPSGYVLVYGSGSGIYAQSVNVGNVTNYALPNLSEGQTYYFAVYAFAGPLQSDLSNEVCYRVPLEKPSKPVNLRLWTL